MASPPPNALLGMSTSSNVVFSSSEVASAVPPVVVIPQLTNFRSVSVLFFRSVCPIEQ